MDLYQFERISENLFKDSIYIGHEITPILDFKLTLSESELIKLAERKIPLFVIQKND